MTNSDKFREIDIELYDVIWKERFKSHILHLYRKVRCFHDRNRMRSIAFLALFFAIIAWVLAFYVLPY